MSDRKALLDIQAQQQTDVSLQQTDVSLQQLQPEEQQEPEDEEEELDVALEGAESEGEEEMAELWDPWDGQSSLSNYQEKNLLRFSSSQVGGAPTWPACVSLDPFQT